MSPVSSGKRLGLAPAFPMRDYSFVQVVGDAGIQHGFLLIGEDVDIKRVAATHVGFGLM